MDIVEVAEIGMLLLGIYYGYNIFTGYTMIKSSKALIDRNKFVLCLALISVIGFLLSFHIYWFTSFYERHKHLEIFLKIILFIFSLFNQMFAYDMDEERFNLKKRKAREKSIYMTEEKLGFKVINRLLLLYIVYKIFNRNNK